MPRLTNTTATYSRTRQPAQYETEKAELSATLTFDETETATLDAASDLLADLATRCYGALGMDVPGRFVAARSEIVTAAGEQAEAAAKRGRGRPKKAEVLALARAKPEEAPTPADPGVSMVLPAPEDTDLILGSPIAVPKLAPVAELEITDKDLQTLCTKTAQRVGNVDRMWKLLAKFGIKPGMKMGDMAKDKRKAFVAEAEAMKPEVATAPELP